MNSQNQFLQTGSNDHEKSPNKRGEQRAHTLLVAFLTLIFIAIVANLVFTLSQARERVLESQYVTLKKLVQVLEQQTVDSLNAVEIALQSSSRAIQLTPRQSPGRDEAVHNILVSSIRNLPFVRAIWVLDAAGNMIHDTERLPGKYNLADRDYFKIHRANAVQGLYIDPPLLSKHGVWFIGVSLRITNPDGSFGGVIAAAFEPKHFRRFYESIKQGNDGIVSLVGTDGTLMLRVPEIAGAEGKRLHPLPKFIEMLPQSSAGNYRSASSVDKIDRIYFYRRVGGRPLVVVVGVGEQEVLEPWRNAAKAYTAVSIAFLALVAWLGYLGLSELRRRTELHWALTESESALASAQRIARIGSWEIDLLTRQGRWSDEMFALLDMKKTPAAPPLSDFLAALHAEDRPAIENAVRSRAAWSGTLRTNPDRGPVRYLYSSGEVQRNAQGDTVAITGTLQDVTERHVADEKLRVAARVFDHMQDAIVVLNTDRRIAAVNDAFERITGYREEEVLDQHPRLLRSERHDDVFYKAMWNALEAAGEWRGEIWGKKKSGVTYPQWMTISSMRDTQGRCTGYLAVLTDISEIKEATVQLAFLANHDPLTRLPNRRLLNDRLQQAIDTSQPERPSVAVLILNIDRLQRVNDSMGHGAGDKVISETASRLLTRVPHGDTLARPGSDEFVVVLTRFDDINDVITFSHQLLDVVTTPLRIHDQPISVTASMGIALYPQDGATAGELLKNADVALSHSKQQGPGTMRFFKSAMNAQALHWISLENALRGALQRGELVLYYQPQVCMADGSLCGVEALLRWRHPEFGMVMPADFIPLAEDIGLIVPIGEWVIHQACMQAKAWLDMGLAPLSVAVNVSGHQLAAGALVQTVEKALAQAGLPAAYLEIELTESVLMRDAETAMQQIDALRKLGVRVSLDDFGTGYSSLGYLSRFTLDKLKIDQCFVRNITTDTRSAAIARATIALAHGLGITVIAEGVETDDQLDYLRSAGCDEIQGYLIGHPLPANQLLELQLNQKSLVRLLSRFTSRNPGASE